jgi:hypothetical protein
MKTGTCIAISPGFAFDSDLFCHKGGIRNRLFLKRSGLDEWSTQGT